MNHRTYLMLTPHGQIEAYTYNGTHCRNCMWDIVFGWNVDGFEASDTVESLLDRAAEVWGIDRQDEESFDSGDFPKIVTAGQICAHLEDGEHELCASCDIKLCEQ